jgi:hypothetical protein
MMLSRYPASVLPKTVLCLALLLSEIPATDAASFARGVSPGNRPSSPHVSTNTKDIASGTGTNNPLPQPTNISTPITRHNNPPIKLQNIGGQLLLEARQAPLAQILRQIADQTGASVHFSVLPEDPVTATCAGGTVKAILECLLANRFDRVYRQMAATQATEAQSLAVKADLHPVELWLIGCRSCTSQEYVPDANKALPAQITENETALLRMAQMGNQQAYAEQRKQAIASLAEQGQTGDPVMADDVAETLREAMSDPDPNIRSQAVFGLMQQNGTDSGLLLEALQDNNPDVRLMAVSSADADDRATQALLRQALNDTDEIVKAAINAKLEVNYFD